MVALRDASIARWFTPDFSEANPAVAKQITDMLAATSPEGYAANCAAVRDADFRDQLASIKTPLLVIAGAQDAVTPPSGGLFIQAHVPGAEYAEFYAAHLSNVQAGAAFSERVLNFLSAH
jgi:3-oxoadipate enol-lactonase